MPDINTQTYTNDQSCLSGTRGGAGITFTPPLLAPQALWTAHQEAALWRLARHPPP